jgi:hypothetical protein
MAEKQYSEWLKYKKWYDKQDNKGFMLSETAYSWYDSYDNYLRQYEYMKKLKEEHPNTYAGKSYYDMIKSRSYANTSAQTEYFYNRISTILNELEEQSMAGDSYATEILNDFYIKYGDLRKTDKQEVIYQHLKGGNLEFQYHSARHYGWYGNIMDMMNYFENNGIIDQIYV